MVPAPIRSAGWPGRSEAGRVAAAWRSGTGPAIAPAPVATSLPWIRSGATSPRGRARLLLGGHEHNLQRLRRRGGVIQFVVGAGGRGRGPVSRDDPRLAFADTDRTGALRLELERGLARWTFVALGGRVLDSGSVRCQPLR